MKTKIYILILATLLTESFAQAENLIKSEQEKIIEKIVTEIFVSGNQYDFLTVSRSNTRASYIDGYGLIIQTPTYHISSSVYFPSGSSRANNQGAYAFSSKSLNTDSLSALRDNMVKELMQKFIIDYSNLARDVKEDEKIYLFYNQKKSRAPGFVGLRNDANVAVWTSESKEKTNRIISAEVKKDDVSQYKAGKIDKNALIKRISMNERLSDAGEKLEYKVLSTVFESAVETQFDNDFMGPRSGVSYQVLDGFGVIYYVKINTPFMFNFMPRLEVMMPEIRSEGNKLIIKNRNNGEENVMVFDKLTEDVRGIDDDRVHVLRAPRGMLGVKIQEVNEDLQIRKELPSDEGVYVVEVNKNSAADEAGIRPGDVILQIEDTKVNQVDGLIRTIRKFNPGDEIEVTYYRDGQVSTVPVKLQVNQEQVEMIVEKAQRMAEENQRAIEKAQQEVEEKQKEIEEAQRSALSVQGYGSSDQQKLEMKAALTELLQTLREYMVEYGSTLPNLDEDDVLMVEFSLEDCHFCEMPKTTTLMVKNDVLQKYDNRQISKEDAVAQVTVSSEK